MSIMQQSSKAQDRTLGVWFQNIQQGMIKLPRFHRFEALFSVVVSGDDVRHSKPAPDCYLLALARLGLRADECLAVEDTEHGLRAASLAGVGCLAVPTEMSRHHDFSLAAGIFADMAAARAHIQTEFARRAGAA